MENTMYYKVVVVGAGPAGVSAAYRLKKNGVDCCLIDRSKFPRFKLCGGLITEKTVQLLRSYGFSDFNTVVKARINEVNILSNGKKILTAHTENYFNLVDRMEFDGWFLEKYLALGGVALLGKRVSEIDLDKKELRIGDDRITYDYIIAADGAKGISSTTIRRKPLNYAFGMEANLETNLCIGDKSQIDLDVTIAKDGYYWRFPKGEKTTVGFAFSFDKKVDYNEVCKKLLPDNSNPKGAFLPYGGNVKTVSDKRGMLLAGDAAGFVDAITGEGTYYAIKSGEIAADSLMTESPVDEYARRTKYICREVNDSWRFIKMFYRFRAILLKLIPDHSNFVAFLCDNQVSTQKGDYSFLKLARLYKNRKREWQR